MLFFKVESCELFFFQHLNMAELVLSSVCRLHNCRYVSTMQKFLSRNCKSHFLLHLLFWSLPLLQLFLKATVPWISFPLAAFLEHKEAALNLHQSSDLIPVQPAGSQARCGSFRVPGRLHRLVPKHLLPDTLCAPTGVDSISCLPKDSTECCLSCSLASALDKLQ